MKFRPLRDRVVIRRVECNGTPKGVEGSIVSGGLTDAKDPDMGSAQTMAGANGMGGRAAEDCVVALAA